MWPTPDPDTFRAAKVLIDQGDENAPLRARRDGAVDPRG